MKEIWIRLNSDTPVFFKKIRKAGLASIGLGTALMGLPATVAGLGIGLAIVFPPIIGVIGGYLIVGGAAAVKIASLAVVDPEVLPKQNNSNL